MLMLGGGLLLDGFGGRGLLGGFGLGGLFGGSGGGVLGAGAGELIGVVISGLRFDCLGGGGRCFLAFAFGSSRLFGGSGWLLDEIGGAVALPGGLESELLELWCGAFLGG